MYNIQDASEIKRRPGKGVREIHRLDGGVGCRDILSLGEEKTIEPSFRHMMHGTRVIRES